MEQGQRQVFRGLSIDPIRVPEPSFVPFSHCHNSGSIENFSACVVTRDIQPGQRSVRVLPTKPELAWCKVGLCSAN
jgi:hypothetical protein